MPNSLERSSKAEKELRERYKVSGSRHSYDPDAEEKKKEQSNATETDFSVREVTTPPPKTSTTVVEHLFNDVCQNVSMWWQKFSGENLQTNGVDDIRIIEPGVTSSRYDLTIGLEHEVC